MKPSKIKPGTKLNIKSAFGGYNTAYFIKRTNAKAGAKATNYLRFPDFAGLDSPEDDGTCQMSDYDLSRQGEIAQ